jgi:hypothetical protein
LQCLGLLLLATAGAIAASTSDLLVNDDTSGVAAHASADIAASGAGRFIVVWQDFRRVDFAGEIYCQCLDSLGAPVDTNHLISEDTSGRGVPTYDREVPAVAGSARGGAVACWEDYRLGKSLIFYQMLDSLGRSVGPNRRISADTLAQTNPRIASGGSHFAAVWEVPAGTGTNTIFSAVMDSAGNTGAEFRIADNPPTEDCQSPAVAGYDRGFVAAWAQGATSVVRRPSSVVRRSAVGDERSAVSGLSHVRLRWFDIQGQARGPSEGIAFENGTHPRLACDSVGNGLIAWEETGSPQRIWAQTFDSAGDMTSPVFQVNDSGPIFRYHPAVAADQGGETFIVVWEDGRNSDTVRIYAQVFDRWGTALGRNFALDSSPDMNAQGSPSVAVGPTGCYASVWSDNRGNMADIYGAYYGQARRFFRANADRATSVQDCPIAVQDGSGRITIFWRDFQEYIYGPRIYGRQFGPDLTPLGSSFPVSDAPPNAAAQMGWAATNRAGVTVVAWQDNRSGHDDIYTQVYDAQGGPIGPNFQVNDDASSADHMQPFVAINDSGRFIIIWNDGRRGYPAPYAQEFAGLGQRLGYNWQVDSAGAPGPVWLSPRGDFWTCWAQRDTIRARHFARDSVPLDSSVIVSDSTSRFATSPGLAVTGLGTVWLVWLDSLPPEEDVRRPSSVVRRPSSSSNFQFPISNFQYPMSSSSTWQIYGRRVSSSGTPFGPVFRINDNPSYWPQSQPAISADSGGYVCVTWTDFRVPGHIEARCMVFDTSGSARDTSFIAGHDDSPGQLQWTYGPPAMQGNNAVLVWQDNRNLRSWDIYAATRSVGVGIEDRRIPAGADLRVGSITPSIVNERCRIQFTTPLDGPVRLSVYNAAGRQMMSFIVHRSSLIASSSDTWLDCRNLPGGVYYLRLAVSGQRSAVSGFAPSLRFVVLH